MPLSVGNLRGPYEILAPTGSSDVGELYRAHGSKLKREIALNVLPASFANDPGRMVRFQREADALASLNRLNIAAIYGAEAPVFG
jgi:eukaryotic-like serine/threonine-protein kinase